MLDGGNDNNSLSLEQIKHGAAIEMANAELQKIFDDIADPNKEGTSVRKMTLEVVFSPTEDAMAGTCVVRCKSTLGKQRDVATTVYFGKAEGKAWCSERNANQPMMFQMVRSEGGEQ